MSFSILDLGHPGHHDWNAWDTILWPLRANCLPGGLDTGPPWPRNPGFADRRQELDLLWEQLRPRPGARRECLVSGVAGSGKTQLALEFTYRHADHYGGCVWADPDQPPPRARRGSLLFILDDLDASKHWLDLVPEENVSILITTRAHLHSKEESVIHLQGFPAEEAVAWLAAVLDEHTYRRSTEVLPLLCASLGYLPFPLGVLRTLLARGLRSPAELMARIEARGPLKWLWGELTRDPTLCYRPLEEVAGALEEMI